ncbi:hypothetical protein PoB_004083400 [Plakobranchus ocellatus]|uniref:Uncharacterized protein n=1 Tax=Plakobranchus ocellatus TaxID=259542 RepID=A0AAV4B2R2_9GAST|nr:hypothetical protein PoB_004083400 [Plakobranchus ocellatus]
MLRGQTSSTKYSPTWAKTSTAEAKEPVENGRRQCVGFGWATHGHTRRTYFSVTDLYRLFREVNPSRIVGYLKDLGVLWKYLRLCTDSF